MEQTRNRPIGDFQCQMILRRQKDLLRCLIHLQTAELSLVTNHRNKERLARIPTIAITVKIPPA